MKNDSEFESWGRFPKAEHFSSSAPYSLAKVDCTVQTTDVSILPRGLGRSYGDVCLNEGGHLLSTKWLDRLCDFNPQSGLLKCEAGVTLAEILRVFVPKGWFLPVTPGTKFVTVGGAIANDVHGKNHHKAGNFGNHVTRFELLRSNGEKIICSKGENSDLFKATIGGLGLTGVILWAEFYMRRIHGPYLQMESIKFGNFDEFAEVSSDSDEDYEYTVAWLDCLTAGRGIFMRANHSGKIENNPSKLIPSTANWKTFPVDAPDFLLSQTTVKLFNIAYYYKQIQKEKNSLVHFEPFFYPLDAVNNWNRMYGKRGFLQWQCVVPKTRDNKTIRIILEEIAKSKLGSFLVVLKEFGHIRNKGLLSFPMPGVTLALDFPNVGERLYNLLDKFDELVVEVGGRIYPAKDARMSNQTFMLSFPEYQHFKKYIDPKFSSSFYRRVMVK